LADSDAIVLEPDETTARDALRGGHRVSTRLMPIATMATFDPAEVSPVLSVRIAPPAPMALGRANQSRAVPACEATWPVIRLRDVCGLSASTRAPVPGVRGVAPGRMCCGRRQREVGVVISGPTCGPCLIDVCGSETTCIASVFGGVPASRGTAKPSPAGSDGHVLGDVWSFNGAGSQ